MTTISRRVLFGKLGLIPFKALESAAAFAKLRGNPYIEIAHWLHQLWQLPNSDLHCMAAHWKFDAAQLEKELIYALSKFPDGASHISDFSAHLDLAVERGWIFASLNVAEPRIRTAWLLLAMLEQAELRKLLLNISIQFQRISLPVEMGEVTELLKHSCENTDVAQDSSGLPAAVPGETSLALSDQDKGSQSALTKYCTDLTALARSGKIDPVVGREKEIRTLTDILLRRRQNNPLLTGDAGVGKTAVVEGLAHAIVSADVPPPLLQVRLLSLDVGALLAGASMRGEFEARLKSVLKEADNAVHPVILFVDEIHTLVGAGGQAGTGDAANLLKPALARGNLRTIGATTWSEYKKHIEKDPALTRRFQVLQIMEPELSKAISMVRGLVPVFMRHHQVEILDEAVCAAVTLSQRYLPSRQLPDKAISLLDTACARVAMSLHTPPSEVVQLRQHQQVLMAEYAQHLREAQLGQSNTASLQRVTQELSETDAKLSERETHWKAELILVRLLLETRDSLLKHNKQLDNTLDNTLYVNSDAYSEVADAGFKNAQQLSLKKIAEIQAELSSLRGEDTCIYAQVDESVIAAIVAEWTGIPVGRMVRDEVSAVMELAAQLEKRVVGQTVAIRHITERIKTSRARLSDPQKPVGCFLLVGPSGVGKTETALALAQAVYGGEHNLITINMSEYQEAHTVSSLKGAPPGYVGYGEGGVLTEAVRRRPYSVILLDEIEKAHPDVHEVFFQVFDKGWMEDGEGRVIDFKNTLILLTSNVGSELIAQLCDNSDQLPSFEAISQALQQILQQVFPVAFLGRLKTIPYLPLDETDLAKIVTLQLEKVVARMKEQHDIVFAYTTSAVARIAAQCGTHNTGARRIAQYIEQNLLSQIAHIWLQASQDKKEIFSIYLDTGSQQSAGEFQAKSQTDSQTDSETDSKTHPHITSVGNNSDLYLKTFFNGR
ncbi:type VI secretion system ATPase TssH [Undibacterium curvum]|uniref:type VI secretion system ATPase TssH n=1 Tax=Undibacterium curvum TaxID=2762294 RepID=UPI001C9B5EFE|nr:type VI secretion system ATPase TssH [Undibacterium curvum]